MRNEVLYLLLHLRHFLKLFQISLDRRVPSGKWAQLAFVVRVGQHAHVKHIVGIHRNAALKTKRLKHERQFGGRGADHGLDIALKLRRAQHTGVNHMGLLAQLREQVALKINGFNQRFFAVCFGRARQRVTPARFGVTAQQDVGGSVKKQ